MTLSTTMAKCSPKKMQVPLSRPSITQADIAAVLEVLNSPSLSLGPKLAAFERAMAEYSRTAEAVAVNSGTSGLHLCLAAAGIGPGDEVITTPFSFVASANCVFYQGASPVFVDIDPLTLNIDPNQVEARLTSQTKAIIPVDVFGQPAPIEELMTITDRYGLRLIRDACEAIGAERNGRRIGSQGQATVFAFYPNKQMTTGEGGMIVTNDVAYSRVVRSMSNQGRDDDGTWMNHVRLGYNYRLDEMSAALGLSQLRRLDGIIARRALVASWYNERLSDVEEVQVPYVAPETTRMSWFVYVVQLDKRIDRDRLMAKMQEDGIPTRPYFVPIHLQPLYRLRLGSKFGDFPVTERIARTTLALPFFTDMAEEQVDYVCERLSKCIRGGPPDWPLKRRTRKPSFETISAHSLLYSSSLMAITQRFLCSYYLPIRHWYHQRDASDNRHIVITTLIIGFMTALFKLFSFIKDMFACTLFGTSDIFDAYLVALLLPSVLASVLAGSLNAALIPTFIYVRDREGNEAAKHLLSGITVMTVVFLILLTVLLALALPYLLPVLAWGFPTEKLALTHRLTLIMLPVIVLSGLATLWGSVLNANERFALVAFSPVTIPLVLMLALIYGHTERGIYVFALGFVLGMLLQVIVLGWGLKQQGYSLCPRWYGTTKALWQVIAQYLPMISAAVFMSMTSVVDQSMASTLGPGNVSILSYGSKVVSLIVGVTSMALGTAVLPYFSKNVASGEWTKLRHILRKQTTLIVAVTFPVTTGVALYSAPFVRLLFQRGRFTDADTFAVAGVQAMYALQIPVYTLGIVYVRLISALGMNKVLVYGTMISFILNITFDWILMRHMGVKGIALATSLVYLVSLGYLYCSATIALRRRVGACE